MTTTKIGDVGQPGLAERVSAAIYDHVNGRMETRVFGQRRRKLLEAARGRVLDVGAGTGVNLPHYRWDQVSQLVLLDVGRGRLARAGRKAADLGIEVELRLASAEQLPFEDESFDVVVFTHSLCTIPDPVQALREAYRVLKPGAALHVLEHVRAAEPGLARWQRRVSPIWKVVSSGCHLDRDTRSTIEAAGFAFDSVDEWLEAQITLPLVRPHLLAVAHRGGMASPPESDVRAERSRDAR